MEPMKSQMLSTKSTSASHAQPHGSRSKNTCIKSTTQKDSIALSIDSNAGNTHAHTHTWHAKWFSRTHSRISHRKTNSKIHRYFFFAISRWQHMYSKYKVVFSVTLTDLMQKVNACFLCFLHDALAFQWNAHRSHAKCKRMFLTRRANVRFF